MSRRTLGVLLGLLLLGLAGGYGLASLLGSREPAAIDEASPVPASPSVPAPATMEPPAPDIDYPALTMPDEFTTGRVSLGALVWSYPVPKGWVGYEVGGPRDGQLIPRGQLGERSEIRWRPEDEPQLGGHSLRAKAVNAHLTTSRMRAEKLRALEALEDKEIFDLEVQREDAASLYFTFRDDNDKLRYNYFRWFAAPGSNEATLEVSISGRRVDEAGMNALFDHVAARARPVS